MELALLYSGGKDSSLAALILDRFYDVTLVTAHFGVTEEFENARRAADALGFPFDTVELDREVADEAIDRMIEDGYPRNGIQRVHEHALEVVAERVGYEDTTHFIRVFRRVHGTTPAAWRRARRHHAPGESS